VSAIPPLGLDFLYRSTLLGFSVAVIATIARSRAACLRAILLMSGIAVYQSVNVLPILTSLHNGARVSSRNFAASTCSQEVFR